MNRGIVAVCSFIRPSYFVPPNQVKVCTRRLYYSHVNRTDDCGTTSVTDSQIERSMGTRYQIASIHDQHDKWIHISFDEFEDTTSLSQQHALQRKRIINNKLTPTINELELSTKQRTEVTPSRSHNAPAQESLIPTIPESVLQYQRQMRKLQAADRAGKTNVNVDDHLHTVYVDDHIVVTDKPSGILCVPGVNKYKSLLDLVFDLYGGGADSGAEDTGKEQPLVAPTSVFPRDSMIVHRLDMDTSGIVIFARNRNSMAKLHEAFRDSTGATKVYEALLVGWLDIDRWIESSEKRSACDALHAGHGKAPGVDIVVPSTEAVSLGGGEIRLPLQRDHRHPPFMRVSTPESEAEAQKAVTDLNHAGYIKLMAKKPKSSTTQFRILSHETWGGYPVTRVVLTPITGRTHQLRVHCAAIGHPILGDPAYGFCGEAHPNGGFCDDIIHKVSPTCASFELRRDIEDAVRENGRTMCLHARKLTLQHPETNEEIVFEAAPTF